MKFSEMVVFARAQLDVSQESLAQMLNVSFSTVNRWEKEKTIPSQKTKIMFAQFCKRKKINFQDETTMTSSEGVR